MIIHPRLLLGPLLARLASRTITVLTGARQTGKTTLARHILTQSSDFDVAYFSLDDPDMRLHLAANPVARLDLPGKLVVLDEVQKLPLLLDAVKLLADQHPERRFLLLGSSQILLLAKVRESLAGRAALLDLWPLSLQERGAGELAPVLIDSLLREGPEVLRGWERRPPPPPVLRRARTLAQQHLRWGGYPALEKLPESERDIWLRDFRRTYLERDLADLGRVADLDRFTLAQNLLAARTGQLLSYSSVSRELGLAVNTIKRYVRFLEISYQLHLLPPLLKGRRAGLTKTPKLFVADPGVARILAGSAGITAGALLETAVLCELLRWRSGRDDAPELFFFRTRSGREVDFVAEHDDYLLALEVRAQGRSHRTDARQVQVLLDDDDFTGSGKMKVGLVVNLGTEVEQLAPQVWAVPFSYLFGPARGDDE